ncbi:MAG: site-specific integrase [Actinomycetota bacterium]
MPRGRMPGQKNTNEYGTGTIIKNPNGTYSGWRTINSKRYKRTARTKTDVRAALNAIAKESANSGTEPSTATVRNLVNRFLQVQLPARRRKDGGPLAPATVERHRWAADKILNDQIAGVRARDLHEDQVEDFYGRLVDDGLSRSSIAKVRNTLSITLATAARKRHSDIIDVTKHAEIPAAAAGTKKRRSLTPDEARTLLEGLRTERNGLAFALSLRLGLRPGEAFGLHWDDVHDDCINVTRGIRLTNGRAEISDDLKTDESHRTIALPDDLVAWFNDHRRAQNEERMAAKEWDDPDIVFPRSLGRPSSPTTTRQQLADVCERVEITPVTPNELRHSCASLLSDEGVPNELIADLLGHTTTRMVDQTYRHRLRPVVDVAASAQWAQSTS